MGAPKTKVIDMLVNLPEGFSLEEKPEPLEVEDDNFRVHIKVEQAPEHRYRVRYEVAFKNPRVEPADYDSLRTIMQAHDRVLDQSVDSQAR